MSDYGQLDKGALDRWITREDPRLGIEDDVIEEVEPERFDPDQWERDQRGLVNPAHVGPVRPVPPGSVQRIEGRVPEPTDDLDPSDPGRDYREAFERRSAEMAVEKKERERAEKKERVDRAKRVASDRRRRMKAIRRERKS